MKALNALENVVIMAKKVKKTDNPLIANAIADILEKETVGLLAFIKATVGKKENDIQANLAHDLHTPMNGIMGFAGLIKKALNEGNITQGGENINNYTEIVLQCAENLKKMIQKTQISSDKLDRIETISPSAVISPVIETYRPTAKQKGVILSSTHQEEEIKMDTNTFKLEQILRNLVNNAIKFTNKGDEIKVTYTINHDTIDFIVADEGIGMTKEQCDLFLQGEIDSQTSTGLGSRICHKHIKDLGGKMEIHSNLGSGSTFLVKIPMQHETITGTIPHLSTHIGSH